MRALALTLTGFRSYVTTATVDFTGKDLAAALGDTGAGKSSLLDAVTYALFRKSSWDASKPGLLIADGASAMSVDFTFLHEGHRWRVHRTMHASNPNAGRHHLINLDTGEETDGAARVDARIRSVLQMGYETFLRVGLLPQGRFDQLLTAAPRERGERLRELFGADSLETVQQVASRHYFAIKGLLGEAAAKRDAMPKDPAQTAELAGAAADAAEVRAERLKTAVDIIGDFQNQIAAARASATAVALANQRLANRTVPGATTIVDDMAPIAAQLAAERESLNSRTIANNTRIGDLTAAIAEGEGQDALGKAVAILDNLAPRTEECRAERDRLDALAERLDAEENTIATAENELAQRAGQTKPLADAAETAAGVRERLHTRGNGIRSRLIKVTTAAVRVSELARDHSEADEKRDGAHLTVSVLEEEAAKAEGRLTVAQTQLDTLELRDRAVGLATDLHPGDDCPVCQQSLPIDFEPASPTGAAEHRNAKALLRRAKHDDKTAGDKLAEARAAIPLLEEAVSALAADHSVAQRKALEAVDAARPDFEEFASLAAEAEGSFDVEAAMATLAGAVEALAAQSNDDTLDPEQLTSPITTALNECEQAASDRAKSLSDKALAHTAGLQPQRTALADRKSALQKAHQTMKADSAKHARSVKRIHNDVGGLPERIRVMLPTDVMEVNADATTAAAAVVADLLTEAQEITAALDTAREEATNIIEQQRILDGKTRTRIDTPLAKLRADLDAWATAAAEAMTHLDAGGIPQLPEAPTESGLAEVRTFAAELTTASAAVDSLLGKAADGFRANAHTVATALKEYAAALDHVDDFDPSADLTAPHAVYPLVAAAARATQEAQDQRTAEQTALGQIRPAADLDFAIGTGQARLEALDVLRRELVDAKFLGHLTTLNTRALLGIASDLLGQMTDQRFGFAKNFDIVSRNSGVVHNANRLSGGEKFLASLALALALAELHSRSGPRLGSLFLDEGFAALDTNALESALEVLRAQAGGDRLVMVISHLHAVAEAVDDVLWVERGPAGSMVRWLAPAERDDLIQADLASGLQALA